MKKKTWYPPNHYHYIQIYLTHACDQFAKNIPDRSWIYSPAPTSRWVHSVDRRAY